MPIQAKFLLEYLQECVELERESLGLYHAAISRGSDPKIKEQLEIDKKQAIRRIELLEDLISHWGGHVGRFKEAVSGMFGRMASNLAGSPGIDHYHQWRDLEAILLVLYQIHASWKILDTVAQTLEDPLFSQAASQGESQTAQQIAYLEGVVLGQASLAIAPG